MKTLEKNIDKNHMEVIWKILNEKETAVIKLKHGFEGYELNWRQIGKKLNMSEESARQYYNQGIRAIRRVLNLKVVA